MLYAWILSRLKIIMGLSFILVLLVIGIDLVLFLLNLSFCVLMVSCGINHNIFLVLNYMDFGHSLVFL